MNNEYNNEWQEPSDESTQYYASLSIDEEGLQQSPLDFGGTEEERKKKKQREENSRRTIIKPSTEIEISEPVIQYNDSVVARKKEIVPMVGAEGRGKTTAANIHAAASLAQGSIKDFPEIKISKNENGYADLYFETEQSKQRLKKAVCDNLKRAGIDGDGPEYCESHYLTEEDEVMLAIEERVETANEKYGGIHLIIIDGGAECVSDTNDLIASKEIVLRQKRLAEKYDCVVIVIVHTNPGSDKPRGHYGSELLRMAASVLLVKQDDEDVSTITPLKLRHAGKKDFPNIQFIFNKEKDYHVSAGVVKTISKKEEKAQKQEREDDQLIKDLFPVGTTLSYDAALKRIRVLTGCSASYPAKIFTRLNKTRKIVETNGFWHIKTATV